MTGAGGRRARARGIDCGVLPPGRWNAITDVPGVAVGHCTRLGGGLATGVTAVLPHGGDLFVFRGRAGSLLKIIWHDGLGMSLYAKRLEKGRFVWPSAKDGVVSLTASQLACLLEGIDWRNPQHSWRPASAG